MTLQTDILPPDLEGLGLEALRAHWKVRWGAAPTLRSPELLRLMLAWRLQALAGGGLDPETRQLLRKPPPARASSAPLGGTRLVREWQGTTHEVVVTPEGGFQYRGQTYKSLSQVARTITGVRWNGPRFFGLRPAKADQ